MTTEIVSGDGTAFAAVVASDGSLKCQVSNTVATTVSNEVTAAPPESTSVSRSSVTVSSTGDQLAASNSGRRQIQIQNLDGSTAVHVRLGTGTASTSDYRLDPGEVYSFPPGSNYTGEINGITPSGTASVIVLEF